MRYPAILAGSLGLAALAVLPAAAQQTPPPLAYVQPLPGPAVQTVQDKLRQVGAYTGRIDGIWGADSQSALERFQQTNQLQVTGQLNQATAATLGLDPNTLVASSVAAPAPPPPPADHLLPASVRAVQARLRTLGFYGGAVGRGVGQRDRGRDRALPARAGSAAGRAAWADDGHGAGTGAGGDGVPVTGCDRPQAEQSRPAVDVLERLGRDRQHLRVEILRRDRAFEVQSLDAPLPPLHCCLHRRDWPASSPTRRRR